MTSLTTIKAFLKTVLPQSWLEERASRRWYQEQRDGVQTIAAAIQGLETRWGLRPPDSPHRPIFIFSAQWQSGSTLLQRLINSDRRVLIWGEPFHKSNLVQSLGNSLRSFTAQFPPEDYFIDSPNFRDSEDQFDRRWTANLYPELQTLITAHRGFYHSLYGQPALDRGFERWGIKEVRLSMDHAYYLKWLFPRAKFLFLYRNPYKAYQSCHTWRDLYLRWPDVPVPTPQVFGTLWREMVEGYQAGYQQVDGLLIKYEDFCAGSPAVDQLSDYLDLNLKAEAMDRKIGSQRQTTPLSPHQIKTLRRAVNPLAHQLGYTSL
ncbi:sulfotransferase [Prochlorothrix hollandica]|uniref:sulfotransferase n=1 Tax=Prochlorothrix hollandica TaxID=1223 RepID=UPI000345578D|nr:sulfotransferase [Prochlorothrix hollandica]